MNVKFTVVAAVMVSGLMAPAQAEERVSIGTGGTAGLFYVIGAGVADIINNHMEGTTARAEVTGASVENIRRVAAEQMTFGFSSSSTLYEAKEGIGAFDGDAQPVAGMAYLYPAVLQVATLADSGITDFAGLAGKRINLGPPGSNAAVLTQRVLEAYGVFDPANAQFLSYTEGVMALTNGTIDATVALAGAPTAALIDLDAQEDMVLLPLDADKAEALAEEYPFYQPYEIAEGTYPDVTEPVLVINDPAALFVREGAAPEFVQTLTATIFDNLDELAGVHPQAAAIAVETAPNVAIPLHPGAQAYFDGK